MNKRTLALLLSASLTATGLAQTELRNGVSLAGSWASAGETDVYFINLEAGDQLWIWLATTPTPAFDDRDPDPRLRILGPAGGLPLIDEVAENSVFQIVDIELSGRYTFLASANDAKTGAYDLCALRLFGYAGGEADPDWRALASDELSTGHITRQTDIDLYTFELAAGDTCYLRVSSAPTPAFDDRDLDPWVRIIAPDQSVVDTKSGENTAWFNITAEQSGTYTAIVTGSGLTTGAYTLSYLRLFGYPNDGPDPDTREVTPGGSLRGTFGGLADLDAYRVFLRKDTLVELTLTTTPTPAHDDRDPDPAFSLWMETAVAGDEPLISVTGENIATTTYSVPESGIYTLLVNSSDFTKSGVYTLNISDLLTFDVDDNGLPDDWETTALDGVEGADSTTDTDQDGLTEWEEYICGTDPQNPDSDGDSFSDIVEKRAGTDPLDPQDSPDTRLEIRKAIEINFTPQVGKSYMLQASDNLSAWIDVLDEPIGGTEIIRKFFSTDGKQHEFYRVVER